jgi:hypothetical protein
MERFSMKEVLKDKFGETTKNVKSNQSTERSNKKAKDNGKYIVKIVDGIKYMVLK